MRQFLDTNVLLYADDLDAGEKRQRARAVLRDALKSDGVGEAFDGPVLPR